MKYLWAQGGPVHEVNEASGKWICSVENAFSITLASTGTEDVFLRNSTDCFKLFWFL